MKHKPYKVLSLIVIASMALAACGGAPATEAPAAGPPAPEPSTGAPATEPPVAYEGMKVEAPNCDYGGEIKSIEAVDEFTVKLTLCVPDPAIIDKYLPTHPAPE